MRLLITKAAICQGLEAKEIRWWRKEQEATKRNRRLSASSTHRKLVDLSNAVFWWHMNKVNQETKKTPSKVSQFYFAFSMILLGMGKQDLFFTHLVSTKLEFLRRGRWITCKIYRSKIRSWIALGCDQGSGVSITTRYRLEGRGFEPCSGEVFSTHPEWPWGSPNVLCNGRRLSFQAVRRPGRRV